MKQKRKSLFITVGLAGFMILLSIFVLTTLLAHAAEPSGAIATDVLNQNSDIVDVEAEAVKGLNILVYKQGEEVPADGVTAQYAVAATVEIAQRVFNKPLLGRVFVSLYDSYGPEQGLFWNVSGEVENGMVTVMIACKDGINRDAHYSEGIENWDWFDSWDEKAVEEERLAMEEQMESMPEAYVYTEEELTELYDLKRQGMLEFAAANADLPHGEKAVELVNSLGIGDGASAVSGKIMMEGCHNDNEIYLVEVALDNGKYVVLTMDKKTMELLAYERYENDLAKEMYG